MQSINLPSGQGCVHSGKLKKEKKKHRSGKGLSVKQHQRQHCGKLQEKDRVVAIIFIFLIKENKYNIHYLINANLAHCCHDSRNHCLTTKEDT